MLVLKFDPTGLNAPASDVRASEIDAIAWLANGPVTAAIDEKGGHRLLPGDGHRLPGLLLQGSDAADAVDRITCQLQSQARGRQAWQASASDVAALHVLRDMIVGRRSGLTTRSIAQASRFAHATSYQAWPAHVDDLWLVEDLHACESYSADSTEAAVRKLLRAVFGRAVFSSCLGTGDLPLAQSEASQHQAIVLGAMLMGKSMIDGDQVAHLAIHGQGWKGVLARSPGIWGLTGWWQLREACKLAFDAGIRSFDAERVALLARALPREKALAMDAERVKAAIAKVGVFSTSITPEPGPDEALRRTLEEALKARGAKVVLPASYSDTSRASAAFVRALQDKDVDVLLDFLGLDDFAVIPFRVTAQTFSAQRLGVSFWKSMATRHEREAVAYALADYSPQERRYHEAERARRRVCSEDELAREVVALANAVKVPHWVGQSTGQVVHTALSQWVDDALARGYTKLVALPRLKSERVKVALSNGKRQLTVPQYELGDAYARVALRLRERQMQALAQRAAEEAARRETAAA